MSHAPLSPNTPTTAVGPANGLLDGTTVPEIDPDAVLTMDELKAHQVLTHEALQRLYSPQERPQSALVRRLLRNGRIINTQIAEGRCVS